MELKCYSSLLSRGWLFPKEFGVEQLELTQSSTGGRIINLLIVATIWKKKTVSNGYTETSHRTQKTLFSKEHRKFTGGPAECQETTDQ